MWFDGTVNGKYVKDSASAVTADTYLEAKAYSSTGAAQGFYVFRAEKPFTARSSGMHMKGKA